MDVRFPLAFAAAFIGFGVSSSLSQDKLENIDVIARYAKGQNLYCTLSSGEKMTFEQFDQVEVYFYSRWPTRVWLSVSGGKSSTNHRSGDYVLGVDTTCNFNGARSAPLDR